MKEKKCCICNRSITDQRAAAHPGTNVCSQTCHLKRRNAVALRYYYDNRPADFICRFCGVRHPTEESRAGMCASCQAIPNRDTAVQFKLPRRWVLEANKVANDRGVKLNYMIAAYVASLIGECTPERFREEVR